MRWTVTPWAAKTGPPGTAACGRRRGLVDLDAGGAAALVHDGVQGRVLHRLVVVLAARLARCPLTVRVAWLLADEAPATAAAAGDAAEPVDVHVQQLAVSLAPGPGHGLAGGALDLPDRLIRRCSTAGTVESGTSRPRPWRPSRVDGPGAHGRPCGTAAAAFGAAGGAARRCGPACRPCRARGIWSAQRLAVGQDTGNRSVAGATGQPWSTISCPFSSRASEVSAASACASSTSWWSVRWSPSAAPPHARRSSACTSWSAGAVATAHPTSLGRAASLTGRAGPLDLRRGVRDRDAAAERALPAARLLLLASCAASGATPSN